MTPTVGTLSEITPDGSREQGPETVGKILVTKQVPKIVKVACRFAKARQRKTVVYMLGAGDSAAHRPDIPMTKRTAEQLVVAEEKAPVEEKVTKHLPFPRFRGKQ